VYGFAGAAVCAGSVTAASEIIVAKTINQKKRDAIRLLVAFLRLIVQQPSDKALFVLFVV
jgi:hypothetical protein